MTTTRFNQPWIDRNTHRLSRRKKRVYRKARNTNNKKDWDRYKNIQKQNKQGCRKARVDSWSGPVALWGLRVRRSFRTPSFPTIIFGASGVLLVTKFGMVLVFSLVKTEDNCSFKSSDAYQLSTRFLREMATSITPSLTLIFQTSLERGTVPDDWKTASKQYCSKIMMITNLQIVCHVR
jgi:hypothetical protein